MKLEEKDMPVEIIRQAAHGYAATGGSPAYLLEEAIGWLYDCYQKTKDANCLAAARLTIQAYMQMGLPTKETCKVRLSFI